MSKEIKKRIDELRWEMEQASTPGIFILNPKMMEINEEITKLQSECEHNFIDGQCEFCYHLEGC